LRRAAAGRPGGALPAETLASSRRIAETRTMAWLICSIPPLPLLRMMTTVNWS